MLSKIEHDYLAGKLNISKAYNRVVKYRIKNKLRHFFMLELPLLQKAGITEFYNAITENNNDKADDLLYNYECGRRDLNPGNGLGRPVY